MYTMLNIQNLLQAEKRGRQEEEGSEQASGQEWSPAKTLLQALWIVGLQIVLFCQASSSLNLADSNIEVKLKLFDFGIHSGLVSQ